MIKTINSSMAKRRAALEAGESDKGFTLIELMVVIIIIGILAAIAIPAFLNQRQNAWDATTKSDISNAEIAAASYSVANNGSYKGMTLTALKATPYNYTPSTDTTDPTIVVSADFQTFTVTTFNKNFTSPGTGHIYSFDSTTGKLTGPV